MSSRFLLSVEDEKHRSDLIEALRACSISAESVPLDAIVPQSRLEGFDALIVELASNGAARVDLLRRLREQHPDVPMLCSIADAGSARLDALYLLRVDLCGQPISKAVILRFVERCTTIPPVGAAAVAERIRRAASATGLSRRETELLALATEGLPRRAIAEALSVSENTVKAQIRSLLKKTGARSLAVLGQHVLRGKSGAGNEEV